MPKPGVDITPGLPKLDNSHGDLLERSMSSETTDWPMFSYSQSQTWDRCEYSWHLAYRKGWSSNFTGRGLSIGTKVHEGADVYYGNECSYDALMAWLKDETESVDEISELEIVKTAGYILKMYAKKYAKDRDKEHKPIATEIRLTHPFVTPKGRNYWFQGYVDLLMQHKNKYKVIDHKTTSTGFWKLNGVLMDPQNVLYAACLRAQGFEITHTGINMLNTYPYKKMEEVPIEKLFLRLEVERTPTELDRAISQFGKLVDRLLDNYTDPRKSLRKACEDCQFCGPCHLGQVGLNQKPLLISNYTKKVGVADA